jgi:hypothetical protein
MTGQVRGTTDLTIGLDGGVIPEAILPQSPGSSSFRQQNQWAGCERTVNYSDSIKVPRTAKTSTPDAFAD